MSNSKNKVFIIGLDGATFDLIKPWIRQGKLPAMKKILKEGVHGILHSTLQPITPPAWVSFQTGLNPGKHGVFDFFESNLHKPHTPTNSHTFSGLPFWRFIEKANKKVGIVNLYATFPPKSVNGFMVTGRGTPENRNFTYPNTLQKRLKDYIIDLTPKDVKKDISKEEFIKINLEILEKRINKFNYLIDKYKPELFVGVFMATDIMEHFFWKEAEENPNKNPILEVYNRIDGFIDKINSKFGKEATIIIVSDHGMGPWKKDFSLNRWLLENEFLSIKTSSSRILKNEIEKLLPKFLFNFLRRGHKKIREEKTLYKKLPFDWNKTRAFSVGRYGNIYINLKNREPNGCVALHNYDKTCEEIKQRLMNWTNPFTKKGLIKNAYQKEECYTGPNIKFAPDLIIEWEDYAYISSHSGDLNVLIKEPYTPFKYLHQSASHRKEGVFMAKGPNIKSGIEIRNAKIMDIAPTILYIFGQKIPSYMDGEVLREIFTDSYIKKRVIEKYESKLPSKEGRMSFSKEESEEIKEKLRNLGYLG